MPPRKRSGEGDADGARQKRAAADADDRLESLKQETMQRVQALDAEGAKDLLEELKRRWQLDRADLTYELIITQAFLNFESGIRESVDPGDHGSYGVRQLDIVIRGHEMEALTLFSHMRTLDLLDQTTEAGAARLSLMTRVLEHVFHVRRVVMSAKMAALSIEQQHFAGLKLDEDVEKMLGNLRMRFRFMDTSKNTPYQDFLLFLLDTAMEQNYRRYGTGCYRPKMVDGQFTNAWEYVYEIKDFVYDSSQKERFWEQWFNSTSSKGNIATAIEHLQNCRDYQFPELKKDRSVFAFRNGVYLAGEDRFREHGTLPNSVVACRYLDRDFDPHEGLRATAEGASGGWREIATPFLQSIFDYQQLPGDACDWVYVLLGRLLYDVGHLDGWQVIPFMLGSAGSGKSTIVLKVAKQFYESADVGVMSNNIEKKFGLSAIANKYIFVAPEIKRDLQVEQAEFQSMVSGEDIQINTKFQTAQSMEWKAAGIMAGNEPPSWSDNQNSLQRRWIIVRFTRTVVDGDMKLGDKLREELPRILLKCNRAYLEAAARWGHLNVWTVLPDYFKGTRDQTAQEISGVEAFLSSDRVVVGADKFCPFRDFVDAFKQFEQRNGYRSGTLTTCFWTAPFQKFELRRVKDQRSYRGEAPKTREWLVGVDLDEEPDGLLLG